MEKLVFCMKWGTRYGPDYVNRLWRSVRRHTTGDVRLVCFTDDVSGIDKAVDCRPLPAFDGVPDHLAVKPWRKLTLWAADLGKDLVGRDALVLDVDLVITGSLDALFAYEPKCPFVVWRNPTKPNSGVGNTSVFRYTVGSHPEILARFVANPEYVWKEEFRIEQELIAARLGDGTAAKETGRTPAVADDPFYTGLGVMRYWPEGWVLSFKEDLLPPWPARFWQVPALPAEARVVAFHGKPDPDEAAVGRWPCVWWKKLYKYVRPTPWVAENWC